MAKTFVASASTDCNESEIKSKIKNKIIAINWKTFQATFTAFHEQRVIKKLVN